MPLSPPEQWRLRMAAFDAVEALVEKRGGFATFNELRDFELEGRRFPLIDRSRGIWNPREFDATLSIVSVADGPYGDHVGADGLLRYDFQAGDPMGLSNRKLRVAMQTATPIIIPDADATGLAAVPNGLALCKIHHAAYDQNLLGISPDYRVHIDRDLLDEVDGPMLRHGLQDMHGTTIYAPRQLTLRPSRDSLAVRFEAFGQ